MIEMNRKYCKMKKMQSQSSKGSIWPISDFQECQSLFAFSPNSLQCVHGEKGTWQALISTKRRVQFLVLYIYSPFYNRQHSSARINKGIHGKCSSKAMYENICGSRKDALAAVLGQFDTRTIWDRGQFDIADNWTPQPIWHCGQFDTMGKNGQFDTADNLTPWVKIYNFLSK